MRTIIRSVIAPALAGIMVAACSGSAASTQAPTQIPTGAPTAEPTVAATATPSAAPSPTPIPQTDGEGDEIIIGTLAASLPTPWTISQAPGGVTQYRGGVAIFDYRTNDPRATGAGTFTGSVDTWTRAGREWGDETLVTARGTWEGSCAGGVWDQGDGLILACWLEGTGDLEGLTYYQVNFAPESPGGARVEGVIYPGTPPPQ